MRSEPGDSWKAPELGSPCGDMERGAAVRYVEAPDRAYDETPDRPVRGARDSAFDDAIEVRRV